MSKRAKHGACPTCEGFRIVEDVSTGQMVDCPQCVTGEWKTGGIGWSGGWREPGGFFYDYTGKWRWTATVVIANSCVLLVLLILFMGYQNRFSGVWMTFLLQTSIFFTLITNIVTFAFANATWKYARDSKEAVDKYSEDLDYHMKELGFTMTELRDLGQAIRDSKVTPSSVRATIRDARRLVAAWKKSNLTIKELERLLAVELPRYRDAAATQERIQHGDFKTMFEGGHLHDAAENTTHNEPTD